MLSAEARVVLLSAGPPANDAEILRLLGAGLDWERLGSIAATEGVEGPLIARLRTISKGALPQGASPLAARALVSGFRLAVLKDRLEGAVEALAGGGVEVMLLKGSALSYDAYASFGERPMGDADLLLLDPGDVRRALDVLLARGWHAVTPIGVDFAVYDTHHHLPPLFDPRNGGATLELHTQLFIPGNPFGLGPAVLRREARRVALRGAGALVPSRRHQLLITCIHFAWAHYFETGAWRAFRDVRAILDAGGLDWDAFVQAAHESRAATACYWTLRLARSLSGVAVPAAVLARLAPPTPAPLLAALEREYALHLLRQERERPSARLAQLVWRLGMRPGWSGHGRFRPWEGSELFDVRATPSGRGGPLAAVVTQLRRAGAWARYARGVLFGRP